MRLSEELTEIAENSKTDISDNRVVSEIGFRGAQKTYYPECHHSLIP